MEVSVIIPTYQPGFYLFDCLSSVIRQDFPKDSFELIIVLNGEIQPYEGKIKSFLEKKGVTYRLISTSATGVSNARNLALNSLNSKYVIFLDDDDILSVNFISGLYSGISPDTIFVSNVKSFISDLNFTNDDYITESFNKCYNAPEYSIFKFRGFMSSVCAKMIPVEIINGFRFDNRLYIGEDAAFMFTISRNIRNIKLSAKDVIYYRRLRPDSASRKRLSFFVMIRNLLQSLLKYSFIYFSAFNKYDFLFYISRLVAAFKFLFLGLFR